MIGLLLKAGKRNILIAAMVLLILTSLLDWLLGHNVSVTARSFSMWPKPSAFATAIAAVLHSRPTLHKPREAGTALAASEMHEGLRSHRTCLPAAQTLHHFVVAAINLLAVLALVGK